MARNEPRLILWSDGTLAVRGAVFWRVMPRDTLKGYQRRKLWRSRVTWVPLLMLIPKGWLSHLNLGQETMADSELELVNDWITNNFSEINRWLSYL